MEKELIYEIRKLLEQSFRRGYSHGFHDGAFSKKEDYKTLSNEISEWRYDLAIQTTPPGSRFLKGKPVKWCDKNELDRVNDYNPLDSKAHFRKFNQNQCSTKLTFEELLKKCMKEIRERLEECQTKN